MKHFLNFTLGLILVLLVFSCAERAICPAYQSAFIHDKATLDRHFSYFGEDSLPKNMLTASKDKFLIIERVPYKKKVRSLNTVPMKTIYPILDDSIALAGDVQMLAEMDVVDSVALDSAVLNELPWKEKFNVDQEFYFHYFNDILVYPEERAQAELDKKNKKDKSAKGEEKQGFFTRMFRSVFKKKDKDKSELVDGEAVNDEEPSAEKKGFLKGLFGKNKKSQQDDSEATEDFPIVEDDPTTPVDDPSSEEEEDDDF